MQSDPFCRCPDGQDVGVLQSPDVVDKDELARRVRSRLSQLPEHPNGSKEEHEEREWLEVTLEILEDPEAHGDLSRVLEEPVVRALCPRGTCEQR